jgi:hypothetical protein
LNGVRRRLLAAGAGTGLLALAVWAAAWGWVELELLAPRRALAQWSDARLVGPPAQWSWVRERFLEASGVNPLKADYHAQIARLHLWQALALPAGRDRSHRLFADAYLAQALERRPGWALAWALAAENRIFLYGVDDRVREAIRHAAVLAPWEPGVQRRVIFLGLTVWDSLDAETRDLVRTTVERSFVLDHQVAETVRLAARNGRLDVVAAAARGPAQEQLVAAAREAKRRGSGVAP